jgi:hypothetical protein
MRFGNGFDGYPAQTLMVVLAGDAAVPRRPSRQTHDFFRMRTRESGAGAGDSTPNQQQPNDRAYVEDPLRQP